jgi:hypothetical protein
LQGEVELDRRLIWIKAVGIEDGNYETVTTGMQPSVIVWDLETVPDLAGFAAANDLVGKSDIEIREAIGDKFPKHIYHSIVCIGALVAHWELDHWAVDAVGAPHVGERTEKELITAFCDKIAELSAGTIRLKIKTIRRYEYLCGLRRCYQISQRTGQAPHAWEGGPAASACQRSPVEVATVAQSLPVRTNPSFQTKS